MASDVLAALPTGDIALVVIIGIIALVIIERGRRS